MLKPLPVGIQTFGDIIRGGFLYVDKTRWIYNRLQYLLIHRDFDHDARVRFALPR